MFGFFSNKNEKIQNAFENIAQEIDSAGGGLEVCKKFADFFINDETRKILGVVPEQYSPYSKITVMAAALSLIEFARNSNDADSQVITEYAENAYIASALMLNSEDLIPIINAAKETNSLPSDMLQPFFDLSETHREAWKKFMESDVDMKNYLAMLINK